ncbi:DUF3152 domain-containing protein [Euzebya tangerina]|uniref:DUF3152 domain-containing protein n=1 Tax=Euzebya tangerina TaxID=591198 RepID=UPI0013C376AB|nr:DUF3152 domain-containing protein [Euzebya tangerina]
MLRISGLIAAILLVILFAALPNTSQERRSEVPRGDVDQTLVVELDVPEGFDRAALAEVVREVDADPRGWSQIGIRVEVGESTTYRLGVATAATMAASCAPWPTAGRFGCQAGPVAMIYQPWWDEPPPWWEGSVDDYRRRAVNHEIGHMVGLRRHPPCPGPGGPLPVMALPPRDETQCEAQSWPVQADLDAASGLLDG